MDRSDLENTFEVTFRKVPSFGPLELLADAMLTNVLVLYFKDNNQKTAIFCIFALQKRFLFRYFTGL